MPHRSVYIKYITFVLVGCFRKTLKTQTGNISVALLLYSVVFSYV